ncbi:MAG: class I SAM-dependent methyltransferase [Trichlorobacter sp.]|jgi:hypothetical protein
MYRSQTAIPALRGPVPLIHLILRWFIQPGNRVVDATCGNGKDTLLLAELAGETGQVWAFDIQPEALSRTKQRLDEAGLAARVNLLAVGHEQLAAHISVPVNAAVFNLGWLPGGDRSVVTGTDTTLPALDSALQMLVPGGLLVVTCYPGHAGGDMETDAVLAWSAGLAANRFHAWRMGQLNVTTDAPFCLLIQKATTPHAP